MKGVAEVTQKHEEVEEQGKPVECLICEVIRRCFVFDVPFDDSRVIGGDPAAAELFIVKNLFPCSASCNWAIEYIPAELPALQEHPKLIVFAGPVALPTCIGGDIYPTPSVVISHEDAGTIAAPTLLRDVLNIVAEVSAIPAKKAVLEGVEFTGSWRTVC